jgi:hypothetical protein
LSLSIIEYRGISPVAWAKCGPQFCVSAEALERIAQSSAASSLPSPLAPREASPDAGRQSPSPSRSRKRGSRTRADRGAHERSRDAGTCTASRENQTPDDLGPQTRLLPRVRERPRRHAREYRASRSRKHGRVLLRCIPRRARGTIELVGIPAALDRSPS